MAKNRHQKTPPSATAVDRAAPCSGCLAKAKDLEERKKWLQSEALRYFGFAQQQMGAIKEYIDRGEWWNALDALARVRNDNQTSNGYVQSLYVLTAPQYGPNEKGQATRGA